MLWNGFKEIEVPELAGWLEEQNPKLRVIDVRQMPEIAAGTVPGAHALPLHNLPLMVNQLNREEKIVMVCRSGARSAQACMFLAQQGFDNVHNLRGGMMAWAQSGQPIGMARDV
jgi:rhodanese-related sulfurtransferase